MNLSLMTLKAIPNSVFLKNIFRKFRYKNLKLNTEDILKIAKYNQKIDRFCSNNNQK